ncbi:hypothetical protein [Synechococcus sp. LTW-R]|uniref:hypothetical protein n=1 Tax=Synechococcus sp. LTW-R TaxID=2751170 RepID=UPI00162A9454|nr:hypothetical protein [Synechococcus sp. LTW-R]QNG29613.1 hypothetical protein H0O22_13145 [Synechococcus sp. LTW-R]
MEHSVSNSAGPGDAALAADRDWEVHNPRVSSEQLEALREKEKLVALRLRQQQQKDLAA